MSATRIAPAIVWLSLFFSAALSHAGVHTWLRSIFSGPAADETCVVMADRRAYCWGETPSPTPAIGKDIASMAMGESFRCALTTAGTVYCWGHNGSGQLGDGSTFGRDTPQPVQYGGADLNRVTAITAGVAHVCALRDTAVWCWGDNSASQMGNYLLPPGTNALLPVQVVVHLMGSSPALNDRTDISAGDYHTCALQSDNTGACWGNGHDGELGNGVFSANSNSPVTVQVDSGGLVSLVMGGGVIRSGGYTTCGLVSDVVRNSVGCWGLNNHGQLGIGNTSDRSSAVPATDERGKIVDASALALGESTTCALVADGTVRCWGSDAFLQLGIGAAGSDQNRGVQVLMRVGVPLNQVLQIVAGAHHVCARTLRDEVFCWGDNSLGQIGSAVGQKTDTPTRVSIDVPMFTDSFELD